MNTAVQTQVETPAPELRNARRDDLIVTHLHLVRIIAGNIQRSLGVHMDLEDLMHAGTMGLLDAATKYQDDKNVPFPVYAKHRIRGAILDSLRHLDWASRDARRQYKEMDSTAHRLSGSLQRTPTHAEVAEAMGIDTHRWQSLMIDFRNFGMSAVQQRQPANEDQPEREIPDVPSRRPDHTFARSEMSEKLRIAMQNLPQRHKQVVKLYYEGDMTMKEIGSVLGVNESRVSQIHKSALAKMQIVLSQNGLQSTSAFCC